MDYLSSGDQANNSLSFDRIQVNTSDIDFNLEDSLDVLFHSSPFVSREDSDLDAAVNVICDATTTKNTTSLTAPFISNGIADHDVNGNIEDSNSSSSNSDTSSSQASKEDTNDNKNSAPNYHCNAVHMEVQENAKIPNLYHIPLRRQPRSEGDGRGGIDNDIRRRDISFDMNSDAGGGRSETREAGLLDEIMRLDEVDWNLTEKFLERDDRMSAAAAYSSAGAMLSSIGTKVDSLTKGEEEDGGESSTEKETKDEDESKNKNIDGNKKIKGGYESQNTNTDGNDKTKARDEASDSITNSEANAQYIAASHQGAKRSLPQPKSSSPKSSLLQSELRSNYSYGRPIPLPIPSPPTLQNSESGTNDKLTTTATSTKTQGQAMATAIKTIAPPPTTDPRFNPYYSYAQPTPNPFANTSKTFTPTVPPKSIGLPVIKHPPTVPTPFLLDATRKRSQFGFGGNHTVPSVPCPPSSSKRNHKIQTLTKPKRKSTKSKAKATTKETFATKAIKGAVSKSTTKSLHIPPLHSIITAKAINTTKRTSGSNPTPPTATLKERQQVQQRRQQRQHFSYPPNNKYPPPPHHIPTKLIGLNQHGASSSSAAAAAAAAVAAVSKTSTTTATTNEGPSYERKKQRAKDARVKLNESIERLSIAMNVVGSQSKQRAQLHSHWATSGSGGGGENAGANASADASSMNGGGNRPTMKLMEDVGKAADLAKKWDRPSFVGTAATVIQGLNSQCEALMREIVELRKERQQWMHKEEGSKSSDNVGVDSALCYQCRDKKRRKGEYEGDHPSSILVSSDSSSLDEIDGRVNRSNNTALVNFSNSSKRRKIECDHDSPVTIIRLLKQGRIMDSIVTCLDPLSITRCTSVSRSWHHQIPHFTDSKIWLNLCVRRFGIFNVRQFQNNLSQDETCHGKKKHSQGISNTNMIQLYRLMNANSVKPRCHFEGNVRLGKGKIDNAVSAWMSAVERSNGETLRTVQSNYGGVMKYVSTPVVELRILIQNIGVANGMLFVPEQIISVDASTKRRGEEMFELSSDERFAKRLLRIDGSVVPFLSNRGQVNHLGVGTLFKLGLFEEMILSVFIHARACQTMAKFRQKAKFVKLLVNIYGTTLPLVIPVTA